MFTAAGRLAGISRGERDPYWSNVSLLLHGDGANGSTTITDSTGIKTLTAVGNVAISTTQSKFGGSSVYFDGSGGYLSFAQSNNFGNSDFTVEFWIYPESYDRNLFAFDLNANNNNSIVVAMNASGLLGIACSSTGSSWIFNINAASGVVALNTWSHIAFVRSGSSFIAFLDGVSVYSNTSMGTLSLISTTTNHIGVYTPAAKYFKGYIDEFRVTKGIARYTANFTPPTKAFPNQ